MKEVIPKEMTNIIRLSNGITVRAMEQIGSYKFFIGKGNNGNLVKNVLKSRG